MSEQKYENLLLVAGTGRSSGKTSLICEVLDKFEEIGPIAIKISPHFHPPSSGLVPMHSEANYRLYMETDTEMLKDSSRYISNGAWESYFIQAESQHAGQAFNHLLEFIDSGMPLICESPALAEYLTPGLFIVADSDWVKDKKDLSNFRIKPDLVVDHDDISEFIDQLSYSENRWSID